jgi:hypothetical protein
MEGDVGCGRLGVRSRCGGGTRGEALGRNVTRRHRHRTRAQFSEA